MQSIDESQNSAIVSFQKVLIKTTGMVNIINIVLKSHIMILQNKLLLIIDF